MKVPHLLIGLVVGLAAALLVAVTGHAADTGLTLTATPNEVELAPGETAHVLVTANIPITAVRAITLSTFAEAAVSVAVVDPARTRQPLRGDLAWMVAITQSFTGRSTGQVYLRADYQKAVDGQLIPGVLATSVDVQERVPNAIDEIVTASLESTLETLQDQQSRPVFVLVKNIATVPVTVTRITAWPPSRIVAAVEDLGPGLRLAPQQTHPFSITLTAGDAVQPGKHLLVVQVDTNWEEAGQRSTGSLVLSREFQAGVFGESEILQITALPSVLFLPGFLLVITLSWLFKSASSIPWWKTWVKLNFDWLELDFKKPEFYYVAITVSLIAVLIYPLLTGLVLSYLLRRPFSSRDLLQGYGFTDIVWLWLGTIAIGLILWAVVCCILAGGGVYRQYKNWKQEKAAQQQAYEAAAWRAARVPNEDDKPLDILRKIVANNQGFHLTEAKFPKGDSTAQSVWVLPSGVEEPGKRWVAPRVLVSGFKGDEMNKFDELKDSPSLDSATELFGLLEQRSQSQDSVIKLGWNKVGNHVRQPTLVEQAQIDELPSSDTFITRA
jgi:hypothetical protein